MHYVYTIFEILIGLVFPRCCVGCGKDGISICPNCLSRSPLSTRNGTIDKDIISVFDYRHPIIREAIWLLKYRRHREISHNLGRILYDYLIEEMAERTLFSHFTDPLLIAIPSAKARRNFRGFNQAELLMRAIKEHDTENRFTIVPSVLTKKKNTPPQAKIKNKQARLSNLRGAFSVSDTAKVENRNIILIDDVATTGATITEAKRALLAGGAKRVIGLTVAH
jgi:competence protein ComFC